MKTNEAKHTPGPWHISTLETTPHTIHHGGGQLASVTLPPYPNERNKLTWHGHTLAESEANARLIAAAPELLAALEKMCDVVAAASFKGFSPTEKDGNDYNDARSAIAKAKGQTP